MAKHTRSEPTRKWWESDLPPMTPEELEVFEEVAEYGRYFRRTGTEPPAGRKPGDPIPDVEPTGQEIA